MERHGYVVLGIRVWKGIFGISVFDVSVAIDSIQRAFEKKVKDISIQFLYYGDDCPH